MSNHENKTCPNCSELFECKVGSIMLCECTAVSLNEEERMYIKDKFNDCLCATCMYQLKNKYHDERIQDQISQLLNYWH